MSGAKKPETYPRLYLLVAESPFDADIGLFTGIFTSSSALETEAARITGHIYAQCEPSEVEGIDRPTKDNWEEVMQLLQDARGAQHCWLFTREESVDAEYPDLSVPE
jgi:hypothetical protein